MRHEQTTRMTGRLMAGIAMMGLIAMATIPVAKAGVIFQDDFESEGAGLNLTPQPNGFAWGVGSNTQVSNVNPETGSYSLQFDFAGVPDGSDDTAEQPFALGGKYPEMWVKYDIFFPTNYFHRDSTTVATNHKSFLYLWEGNYQTPSGPGMGPAFWPDSAITGTAATGQSISSFAVWGVPGINPTNGGSEIHFGPWNYPQYWANQGYTVRTQDLGKWMQVILHFKYASSANNDGVAQIWLQTAGESRRQVLNITNGPWYVAGQVGFDQGYLLGWANDGFAQDTKIYIDNIEFSTDPIGMDPPAAPTVGVR